MLLKEKDQPSSISENDKILLQKYKGASSCYIPRRKVLHIKKGMAISYTLFSNREAIAKVNNRISTFLLSIPISKELNACFQAISVKEDKDNFILAGNYIYGKEPEFNQDTRVFALISEVLLRDSYNASGEELIAEQHARTVGELPQSILECFYPELLEYDEKDIENVITLLRANNSQVANSGSDSLSVGSSQSSTSSTSIDKSACLPPSPIPADAARTAAAATVPQAKLHGNLFAKNTDYQQMDRMLKARNILSKQITKLMEKDNIKNKVLEALISEDYNLALRRASAAGKIEVIKLIIESNDKANLDIDFTSTSSNGNTAYDWAVESRNTELISYLENKGAKSGKATATTQPTP